MATGDIQCGTSVLGDPDPGQAKECQCFKPSVIPKSLSSPIANIEAFWVLL